MAKRKIKPVTDNLDKQRTYREHKGRYKRGMENEWTDEKNLDSLSMELKAHAEKGMQLANFFDSQEKLLKRGNKIRKSANLQMK